MNAVTASCSPFSPPLQQALVVRSTCQKIYEKAPQLA